MGVGCSLPRSFCGPGRSAALGAGPGRLVPPPFAARGPGASPRAGGRGALGGERRGERGVRRVSARRVADARR